MNDILAAALLASRLPAAKQDFCRRTLLKGLCLRDSPDCPENPDQARDLRETLSSPRALASAEREIVACQKDGIGMLSLGENSYPAPLLSIHRPPLLLFFRGRNPSELSLKTGVGIVGSRRADISGCDLAQAFAGQLAATGGCVVSGLALGVDAAAHKGALKSTSEFPTIAVMGCGLRQVYPRSNERLARQIVDRGGTLLSHFEPDEAPFPANFLDRNRVIAGLSAAVLVVQAPLRSGSLVTARYALEEGRDVMAIPGPINQDRWAGSNRLIQQGAYLVTSPEDVIALIPSLKASAIAATSANPEADSLSEPQRRIVKILKLSETLHYEELCRSLGQMPSLQSDLLELELGGVILRLPGNYVALAAKSG